MYLYVGVPRWIFSAHLEFVQFIVAHFSFVDAVLY